VGTGAGCLPIVFNFCRGGGFSLGFLGVFCGFHGVLVMLWGLGCLRWGGGGVYVGRVVLLAVRAQGVGGRWVGYGVWCGEWGGGAREFGMRGGVGGLGVEGRVGCHRLGAFFWEGQMGYLPLGGSGFRHGRCFFGGEAGRAGGGGVWCLGWLVRAVGRSR